MDLSYDIALIKDFESARHSIISDLRAEVIARSTVYIRNDLHSIATSFCKLGFHLRELKYSGFGCYEHMYGYPSGSTCMEVDFYDYVQEVFGFSKTTCNNYIRVCELFSREDGKFHIYLNKKYEKYGFSQLVEMASMSSLDWDKVKPEMTVRQIRELKQSLFPVQDKRTDERPDVGSEPNQESVEDENIVDVPYKEADVLSEKVKNELKMVREMDLSMFFARRTGLKLDDELLKCLQSSIKNVDKVKNLKNLLNEFWGAFQDYLGED